MKNLSNKLDRPPGRLVFVSWAANCSRSDSIAARLGGTSHLVYAPSWGSNYLTAPLKYAVQTMRTWKLLMRDRPSIVLVMAPPVIACVPVLIYCYLFGARYAIDAHTAAFTHRRWKNLQFLQRFFSRRAVTTIVTNRHLAQQVENWGARSTIVTDVPVCFADPEPVELPGQRNVTVVSSYCDDEPTEALIQAASGMEGVTFHFTGNYRKLPQEVIERKPPNVVFTGFLTDAQYVGQLQASDAVVAMTTRDHTMQRGAYEAIYLGKPILTSDFELLQDCFDQGAVHAQPSLEGIEAGMRELLDQLPRYTREAAELCGRKREQWREVARGLRQLFHLSDEPENVRESPAEPVHS